MHEFFLEAENFDRLGGWVIDQQSMETLHSSYIMAHGMGVPVADAETRVRIDAPGHYRVWARTRDWTAVWQVPDSAGKFQLIADGTPLSATLGTNGADWAWQRAGDVWLDAGVHTLALHDLTGFNGRCDAVYLTDAPGIPDDPDEIRARLHCSDVQTEAETYDLIVVGGGIAGICTALAALRSGVRTLLLHDRPVLGGCNSSEIRVCMGGQINLPPYERLGDVVKEIAPITGSPQRFEAKYYEDDRKLLAFENGGYAHCVRRNQCVTAVETDAGRIRAVICTDVRTGQKRRFRAALFADCTGDAVVARLAGASVMYGRESADTFGESLAPAAAQKIVMGHSIRWYAERVDSAAPFPDVDWGLRLSDETCLNVYNGDWEQETGFSRDMVREIEYIRDFGLRAIFANWAYQKNHFARKAEFADYRLKWVSPLGGKRESYRVVGDYILRQQDIENHVPYADGTACMTWDLDMHFPDPDNAARFGEPFRSFAYHRGFGQPYPVPYRCLYARDVDNLFLGGRIVSASHVAFSALRVMRTLGQLGEVVGMAAGICCAHGCLPRAVGDRYLPELRAKMHAGVCIPCAFSGELHQNEGYHFKDAGWFFLNRPCEPDESALARLHRGMAAAGVRHKYPVPPLFADPDAKT